MFFLQQAPSDAAFKVVQDLPEYLQASSYRADFNDKVLCFSILPDHSMLPLLLGCLVQATYS
jgi:hypothetical protein